METRRAQEAELKRKKEAQEKMQQQMQMQRLRKSQENDLLGQYATMRQKQMTERRPSVAVGDVPVLGPLLNRTSTFSDGREEKGSPHSPRKRLLSGVVGFFGDTESGNTMTFAKSNRIPMMQSMHSRRRSSHFERVDSTRFIDLHDKGSSGDLWGTNSNDRHPIDTKNSGHLRHASSNDRHPIDIRSGHLRHASSIDRHPTDIRSNGTLRGVSSSDHHPIDIRRSVKLRVSIGSEHHSVDRSSGNLRTSIGSGHHPIKSSGNLRVSIGSEHHPANHSSGNLPSPTAP